MSRSFSRGAGVPPSSTGVRFRPVCNWGDGATDARGVSRGVGCKDSFGSRPPSMYMLENVGRAGPHVTSTWILYMHDRGSTSLSILSNRSFNSGLSWCHVFVLKCRRIFPDVFRTRYRKFRVWSRNIWSTWSTVLNLSLYLLRDQRKNINIIIKVRFWLDVLQSCPLKWRGQLQLKVVSI